MASEIKMPQLSDTMHAGKILGWMKKEGDSVNRGDVLAEVETDKANLQIEAFQQGVLLKIVVPANQTATVGDTIALIGQAGENVAASTTGSTVTTTPSTPTAQAVQHAQNGLSGAAHAPLTPAKAAPTAPHSSERIKASPLARKIAEQKNIDLSVVRGSGPLGRIVKKDLENAPAATAAIADGNAVRSPSAERQAPPVVAGAGTLTPLSKMRETIARRMQESVTTSPHFYMSCEIRMREAMKLRELLKEREEFKGISVNHLVIKAAAYALQREPRVNCAVRDNQLYQPAQINVGIITAIDDGILVPVVREANQLALKDLVFEARAAVERARAGRPNSTDLSGGTFSISNMGMFDVDNFTAIINPGQGAILAVSSVKEQVIVEQGQPTVGMIMRVTLSVDHRIIDGVMAGTFLKHFKQALETPALLLL